MTNVKNFTHEESSTWLEVGLLFIWWKTKTLWKQTQDSLFFPKEENSFFVTSAKRWFSPTCHHRHHQFWGSSNCPQFPWQEEDEADHRLWKRCLDWSTQNPQMWTAWSVKMKTLYRANSHYTKSDSRQLLRVPWTINAWQSHNCSVSMIQKCK